MKHQFNNVSFHFRLFPGKCKVKVFEKIKKNYFGGILSPFCQNLGKNEFSGKRGSDQFLNILIIYHRAKNLEKLMIHS